MKKKNILIFLCFIMIVVGIGCVSAENIDEISNSSSDDIVSLDDDGIDTINSVESEVLTSSVEDKLSDGESTQYANTWADLQSYSEDTNVDIVKLNSTNIAPSSDSSDQISLNHDITIVGGEGYYIGSADWNSAPVYNYIPIVTSGSNLNVKFENITFQYLSNNVFMKLMGNGNYTFKNCVFNHINATGDHQSVIWLNYGYALIDNCTFTNCKCSFGAVTNYYTSWGTAVNNARMTVKDSTFNNNYCPGEPGCINNCGYLEVYDSTFENNVASWWAGAIHTHSRANTTIVRSTFKNNYAGWYGGALFTYSYLHVINSTFLSNKAVGDSYVGGGAIGGYNYIGSYPYVIVENSIFKYNDETNFRGGAIAVAGKGNLEVYNSSFLNNSAKDDNSGHAIAYYYDGSSSTAAYFTYINNSFYGPNNGNGSVYIYNDKVNVVESGNNINDYSSYVDPEENNTNGTSGNVTIPDGTTIGSQVWNASLSGALGGTPVISGNYILIPAGHTLYCYYLNGTYVWNLTSEWGYFKELLVDNNVVYAPCSWDRLFILNLTTGNSLTNANIYQGSSLYAPVMYNNTLYIASEYGYGSNNNTWITMVKYVDGDYVYYGSILELNNVSYGTQALLSEPIIYGDYLYINTIYGLIRYNLLDNTMINITDTVGNPVIDSTGNICVLRNVSGSIYLCLLDSDLTIVDSELLGGNCSKLVGDGEGNVYTVDTNGHIYLASYSGSSLSCEVTTFNINPVSSAMYCDEDYLYLGDDAGILWVFDLGHFDFDDLEDSLSYAFNATYSIVGGITVYNSGIVYIGNNNADFYAIH